MSSYSGKSINALCGSLVAISTITVALRVYARHKAKVGLGWDDWIMVSGFVFFLAVAGSMFEFVHAGALGQTHIQSAEQLARITSPLGAKLQIALVFLDCACLAATKASVCFLYYRIFCVQGLRHSVFGKVVVATIVLIVLWSLMAFLLAGLSCKGHFNALWTFSIYPEYCGHAIYNLYGIVISDVIMDVIVLALPIVPIFQLHAPTGRKIVITGVFLLGAVALGASIARLVIFTNYVDVGVGKSSQEGAELFLSRVYFYYTLECGISVIAINLPIIGPLLFRMNLDGMAKVARSIRSLGSGGSRGSGRSRQSSRTNGASKTKRSSNDQEPDIEQHPLHEVYISKGDGATTNPAGIHVEDSVDISSEIHSGEEIEMDNLGFGGQRAM